MSGYPNHNENFLMPEAGQSAPPKGRSGTDRDQSWLSAAIVDSSADAIVATDLLGTILNWNDGAARLFGYRAEEAIGQSIRLLVPPEQIPPLEGSSEEEQTRFRFQTEGQSGRVEAIRLTKDQRRIAVSITVSPLKDRHGRVIGTAEISREANEGGVLGIAVSASTIPRESFQPVANYEELGSSEQLHRVAFALAPIGMCSFAPDGRLLEVNESLCQITGYAAAELGRMRLAELTHPDDQAGDAAHLNMFLSGAASIYANEKRLLRKDGEVRWVSARATPLTSSFNLTEFGLGLFFDISDRKRAEAQLVEREGLLSALVEQASTGMYVLDDQFRVLHFNALAVPVFERFQPVIGRDFQEILESLWGLQVGGEIARIFRRTLETGKHYVSRNFTESRANLGVEQTYEWEIQRLTLPNGKFALVFYFADVTEPAQLNRLLIENERRFRDMIDALPAAVYTTDRQGYLTHFNPAAVALAGRTPELGTDRWCVSWKLLLPDGTPLAHKDCPMAIALQEGRIVHGAEVILERPDGTRIWFTPFPSPIRDSTGGIVGGINMLLDITDRKKAEEALRESQAHARLATEASAVGIWEWNLAAETIRWDRVMFGIYGIEPTEDLTIPRSTWRNAVLAEDLAGQEQRLKEIIRPNAQSAREFRIRRPGEEGFRIIRSMNTVRTNAQGEVQWLLGTNVDITEQKRAEQALQVIETRLRLGMDMVGLALAEVDYVAETVQLTDDAARLFGLGDTAMATPLKVLVGAIHPDDRDELSRRNEAALDPAGDGLFSMDFRVPRPSGDLRWVRVRGQVSFGGTDLVGRSPRAVLAVLDMTTEKAAEDSLRASETRFRQLADSMPQLVWSTQADGFTDLYNHEWFEYTGLPYEELEGVKWTAVIHPDDLPGLGERWRISLRSGEQFESEARYRRFDGVYRWFLVRARAVFGEDDRVVRWFGTSTDIHEQKHFEDDLRRANRDLESFAFTASHDLQEPLRNVALYGQLFRKRYGSELDTTAIQYLDCMVEGVQRMSELITDLLAYTQAGNLDAETRPRVAAESALVKVLVDLQAVVTKNQASVTHDPLPVVSVQEIHLHQLLQNLISNALKYRKESESPRVHISAVRQEQEWLFSVKDNGIGIAPEYQNQVFGIFKRLHVKGSKYEGTGIGLAICQKTIERYDGRIWVESKLGEGSTFYFTVPINEVDVAE